MLQSKNSYTSAKAAGNSRIHVHGQSVDDIIIKVIMESGTIAELNLDVCLIVKDLGTDILIGQPAKIDNQIVTIPHKQQVSFRDIHGKDHICRTVTKAGSSKVPAEVVRCMEKMTLYPGDTFRFKVPEKFQKNRVVFSPRKPLLEIGFTPKVLKLTKDRHIEIVNDTDCLANWKKDTHIGDLREALTCEEARIAKLYTYDEKDFSPTVPSEGVKESFTQDIVLDPDNRLDEKWKTKFKSLCEKYTDIIQYKPGIYNGNAGE